MSALIIRSLMSANPAFSSESTPLLLYYIIPVNSNITFSLFLYFIDNKCTAYSIFAFSSHIIIGM